MGRGKRGRPLGFKLSEYSKDAISRSKVGQKHTQETKDKISKALRLYFKKLNPLSRDIEKKYCRPDDEEMCAWMDKSRRFIDTFDDVRTGRSMKNSRNIEVSYGQNIECFSHALTPERILELFDECVEKGLDTSMIENLLFGGK